LDCAGGLRSKLDEDAEQPIDELSVRALRPRWHDKAIVSSAHGPWLMS
jgi:hypothetical protein